MCIGVIMVLGQCCPFALGETSYNPRLEPRFNPKAADYYQNVGELMYNPASTQLTEPFSLGEACVMQSGGIPGRLGGLRRPSWFKKIKNKIKKWDPIFGLGETVASPADTGGVLLSSVLKKKNSKKGLGYAESGSVWSMGRPQGVERGLGYPISAGDYGALGYAASSQDYGALGVMNIGETIYGIAGLLGLGLGAYHGYKRHNSLAWGAGWGLLGSVLPGVVVPLALCQGLGKRKGSAMSMAGNFAQRLPV